MASAYIPAASRRFPSDDSDGGIMVPGTISTAPTRCPLRRQPPGLVPSRAMAQPDLTNVLPPLYARWMAELLQGPLPDESHCTCDDCAVARKPGVRVTVVEKGKVPRFEPRPF